MDCAGDADLRKDNRTLRTGRVVDTVGRPVAGALVAVVWGTAPTPDIGRRTNDEGAFQVGLEPGRYRIQAVTPGAKGEVEIEVEGGQGEEIIIQIQSPDRLPNDRQMTQEE
jgi:hypothetical protein